MSRIMRWKISIFWAVIFCTVIGAYGQHSVARQWNEVLLEGIRNDYARPTVHARNLFHISAAMYDAWAIHSDIAKPYLVSNTLNSYTSEFGGFVPVSSTAESMDEAISFAAYRLIEHRFQNSPGGIQTLDLAYSLMVDVLGYDPSFTSTDYSNGSAAALGNHIASEYIAYGLLDGSNEENGYVNQFYVANNDPLDAESPGNPNITDPNRWQPLAFDVFVDQSGNEIPGAVPEFLSPEWGQVWPFSLREEDKTVYNRDGFDYQVYHDPGPPPYLDPVTGGGFSNEYKWNFSLVAIWSGHLDPTLNEIIDISPGSIGNLNIQDIPQSLSNYDQFYDYLGGGDPSIGHDLNPKTGLAYEEQLVNLGDYGRILAEFWADGPNSETPPGHWFTILNYVSDHPDLVKKFNGQGDIISDLEWDVKAYFLMGGAMHDVAITAWGIKGYYDYIRPISAIRYMADKGQSSDDQLPNYDIAGIPLVTNHIELVLAGDPLAGDNDENLNKIKLWAWKGPSYILDPAVDEAGVGWILAENWWPYQRPSFITPPFAGYVSGHSTYSRAAAEIMTLLTGDPFFPGGMGEFEAPMNEFLVFEEGPSIDITLQWATYRDASDQCSLSRIWGGIHPPADDIPGRFIGEKIGKEAFLFVQNYFYGLPLSSTSQKTIGLVYPNPVQNQINVVLPLINSEDYRIRIFSISGQLIYDDRHSESIINLDSRFLPSGKYVMTIEGNGWSSNHFIVKK